MAVIGIEKDEESWDLDFARLSMQILNHSNLKNAFKPESKNSKLSSRSQRSKGNSSKGSDVYFRRDYQKIPAATHLHIRIYGKVNLFGCVTYVPHVGRLMVVYLIIQNQSQSALIND